MTPATSENVIQDDTLDAPRSQVVERTDSGPDIDPPAVNYPLTFNLKRPIMVPVNMRVNVGYGAVNSDGTKREVTSLELSAPTGRMFMKYGAFSRPITRERIDPVTREQTFERFTEVNYPALLNYASDMSGIPLKYMEEMHGVDIEGLGSVIVKLMYDIPS